MATYVFNLFFGVSVEKRKIGRVRVKHRVLFRVTIDPPGRHGAGREGVLGLFVLES